VLLPKIKKNSQKYQRTVGYPSTSWASCCYIFEESWHEKYMRSFAEIMREIISARAEMRELTRNA